MITEKKDFVFGIHAVDEAIKAGHEIDKVLVRKDINNTIIKELLSNAYQLNIPILKVPKEKLSSITGKNHQGIIALLSSIKYASLDHVISNAYQSGQDPVILLLDRVTDVRNFGAISRTAEGLGFHGIVIPDKGGARLNNEAVKTSSGALLHLPVCRVKSLLSTLEFMKNNGMLVVSISEKADNNIYEADMKGPLCLVLGSESEGIHNDILKKSDKILRIPMYGKKSSYNDSVSMAIAGSEIIRQAKFKRI